LPRPLDTVLGTTASTLLDALAIKRPAHNMIAHAGQILYATTANEHYAMLLQIMPLVRNVGNHFHARRETHFRDLANGGVRFLGRASGYLHTNTSPKWTRLQGWRLGLGLLGPSTLADKLVDCGHGSENRV